MVWVCACTILYIYLHKQTQHIKAHEQTNTQVHIHTHIPEHHQGTHEGISWRSKTPGKEERDGEALGENLNPRSPTEDGFVTWEGRSHKVNVTGKRCKSPVQSKCASLTYGCH